MGLFRKTTKGQTPPATPEPAADEAVSHAAADTTALDELRAELAALRERLDASDRTKAELEATVETLNKRLIVTAPPPAPPAAPPPPPTPAPIEQVTAEQHAATDAAVTALQEQLTSMGRRIELVDTRVTAVSTELANQLSEIGNDIEPMHDSAERLAAEQARYQIQFRQDLAELAERIRRPGTT